MDIRRLIIWAAGAIAIAVGSGIVGCNSSSTVSQNSIKGGLEEADDPEGLPGDLADAVPEDEASACLGGSVSSSRVREVSVSEGLLGFEMPRASSVQPSAAVRLYRTAGYQAPLSARGGALLNLTGEGLEEIERVVYRRVSGKSVEPPPASFEGMSKSEGGLAERIVRHSSKEVISVELPQAIRPENTYAVWALDKSGSWSLPIIVNAPFPMWISPGELKLAESSRTVRIAGRNLAVRPGFKRCVRLSQNERSYIFPAMEPKGREGEYLVEFELPEDLPAGSYTVDLALDGNGWARLKDERLVVVGEDLSRQRFDITQFGGCSGADDSDDILCITRAMKAAEEAGGGEVYLPAGTWRLDDPVNMIWENYEHGIVVPEGVDLVGAGADVTKVVQGSQWTLGGSALFTLAGSNSIRNITFEREKPLSEGDSDGIAAIRIGMKLHPSSPPGDLNGVVKGVVIENCRFEKVDNAIASGGQRIERLSITGNQLAAHSTALAFWGGGGGKSVKFIIKDLIVEGNSFTPGGYKTTGQGPIAMEVGGSDSSIIIDNVVDGRNNGGWRAGFFWHLGHNNEKVLVASNDISCSGDKSGDGEAISFDSNDGLYRRDPQTGQFVKDSIAGFAEVQYVSGAAEDWVSAASNELIHKEEDYYRGHWVFVVDGPGTGQARRIDSYEDILGKGVRFRVSPAWDVIPVPGKSRIVVYKTYWQVHVTDNDVDHTGCRLEGQKGLINWFANFLDSTISYNKIKYTEGILVWTLYTRDNPGTPGNESFYSGVFASEIFGNTIEGRSDSTQRGGITLSYGAERGGYGPVLGQSVNILGNEIDIDFRTGISVNNEWWLPKDRSVRSLLIQKNTISGASVGINIGNENAQDTVLFNNTISVQEKELVDEGKSTIRIDN